MSLQKIRAPKHIVQSDWGVLGGWRVPFGQSEKRFTAQKVGRGPPRANRTHQILDGYFGFSKIRAPKQIVQSGWGFLGMFRGSFWQSDMRSSAQKVARGFPGPTDAIRVWMDISRVLKNSLSQAASSIRLEGPRRVSGALWAIRQAIWRTKNG